MLQSHDKFLLRDQLRFHNSFSGKKEIFQPLDTQCVRMYVCGPTVYGPIHIGNARTLVVFDVLYRLLAHLFPKVVYVRNITDVDDKINAAAASEQVSIQEFTRKTIKGFHEDCALLFLAPPTIEPKATDYINHIIELIQKLLEQKNAYINSDHILFAIEKSPQYGILSKMPVEEMQVGARVEQAPYKNNPLDFVLWKPSQPHEVGWDSPWGYGRPGWHSECAAMSTDLLGPLFDIHGGGCDLLFPHHENEMAQICALSQQAECARYWLHNNMLLVEGQKMSKSLGNFVTLQEVLQSYSGEVVRWALLSSHYRHPLDWTEQRLIQAKNALDYIYQALTLLELSDYTAENMDPEFLAALSDDLNTPLALQRLQALAKELYKNPHDTKTFQILWSCARFMGLAQCAPSAWFQPDDQLPMARGEIQEYIQQRQKAREDKDYVKADRLRQDLATRGILLEDTQNGTLWRLASKTYLHSETRKDREGVHVSE